MSLENFAQFNDLSPKLRQELEDKVAGFGKTVRYKFDIVKPNPDPTKYNGEFVYPNMYTLDPTKFSIQDPYEDRAGKSKSKNIALVNDAFLNDRGIPERFIKVKVLSVDKGILKLNVSEKTEDKYVAMFLELHPKLTNGKFADKNAYQVIKRIDEKVAANTERTERTAKVKALNIALGMSDEELVNFADAMGWDSTEDAEIIRNQAENLAENEPVYFNDMVGGKTMEYLSVIKQATDRGLISFNPAEYKYIWEGNKQAIAVLSPTGEKAENEKLAEWFQVGGDKADKVFKKLKSLLKGEKEPA
jgi:hypothetical protein